jgi:hypothetical protein
MAHFVPFFLEECQGGGLWGGLIKASFGRVVCGTEIA